ncbi:hypothetical protein [Microtetraspora sp. NBRC 16547]|uniref:hypothetical protein n=1 Tax=Microtetraspora sp. NBRC 16547 TaxID=3030993 RepID=UPI0024A2B766|nr:hypothetical protein [Microtetraspora sp. NBRC 16547]GLW97105.1 hypothetical protein Misp02_11920 [Microtetraspora sp. NBRC 16547]
MRSADPDDIDARFEALVAQFGEEEILRMEAMAAPLSRPGRRRTPVVMLAVLGVVALAGAIISLRPDLLGGDTPPSATPHPLTPAVVRPARDATEPPATDPTTGSGSRDTAPSPSATSTAGSPPPSPSLMPPSGH